MLIIGCGNRQRGDDAAGIVAAERLMARGIPAEISSGDASELMEMWAGSDDVIVIDAVVTGAEAGAVHVWELNLPLPHGRVSGSTHGFGIAEAIEISRALGNSPRRLRIYGIEGKSFEMGSAISPGVEHAVETVVFRIAGEVAKER